MATFTLRAQSFLCDGICLRSCVGVRLKPGGYNTEGKESPVLLIVGISFHCCLFWLLSSLWKLLLLFPAEIPILASPRVYESNQTLPGSAMLNNWVKGGPAGFPGFCLVLLFCFMRQLEQGTGWCMHFMHVPSFTVWVSCFCFPARPGKQIGFF